MKWIKYRIYLVYVLFYLRKLGNSKIFIEEMKVFIIRDLEGIRKERENRKRLDWILRFYYMEK